MHLSGGLRKNTKTTLYNRGLIIITLCLFFFPSFIGNPRFKIRMQDPPNSRRACYPLSRDVRCVAYTYTSALPTKHCLCKAPTINVRQYIRLEQDTNVVMTGILVNVRSHSLKQGDGL
jgi:hypothetical protein